MISGDDSQTDAHATTRLVVWVVVPLRLGHGLGQPPRHPRLLALEEVTEAAIVRVDERSRSASVALPAGGGRGHRDLDGGHVGEVLAVRRRHVQHSEEKGFRLKNASSKTPTIEYSHLAAVSSIRTIAGTHPRRLYPLSRVCCLKIINWD